MSLNNFYFVFSVGLYDAPTSLLSASRGVFREIFIAIQQMDTNEKVEKMLTFPLLMRIDQVTYGCICENPKLFEDEIPPKKANTQQNEPKTQELYHQFTTRFRLEIKPGKIRDI